MGGETGRPAAHLRVLMGLRLRLQLTRKDLMVKNLKRQKKMLEREERTAEASKSDRTIAFA
jgi:hypothetical protein